MEFTPFRFKEKQEMWRIPQPKSIWQTLKRIFSLEKPLVVYHAKPKQRLAQDEEQEEPQPQE